jgi:transposase
MRSVAAEAQRETELLDGLRRIGIDEIPHRKGQRYLTVVVDHDSDRLAWAAAGRDRKTVEAFFDELGETCRKQIELVSCDMAGWIAAAVADRVPDAVRSSTACQRWRRGNQHPDDHPTRLRLPRAPIALTMLSLAGLCPPLPR